MQMPEDNWEYIAMLRKIAAQRGKLAQMEPGIQHLERAVMRLDYLQEELRELDRRHGQAEIEYLEVLYEESDDSV